MSDEKIDYKHTLNLPTTDFAMKANLAQREPAMLEQWQKIDIYQQIRQARTGREKFILHDGPPYANGNIHIGHALNKILKDMIVKSQTLNGFDAPYVPGWDCHGLPIELNVEKKVGKPGQKLSPTAFREQCRAYAESQINIQREAFMRLGVLGDWYHPYETMAPTYEADIIRSLAKIIERGHLVRGYKPVHWCLDCQSSLAEAEVEYKDKESPAIDVAFRVLDEEAFVARLHQGVNGSGEGPISLPIWTTTPWTLPANQAVALNPAIEYALVQCKLEHGKVRLFVAQALLQATMDRYDVSDYHVVAYGPGSALEGLSLQHPFYPREVPIVLGEHVTVDAGTGCVHTAPAHGVDDYQMGLQYKLPIHNPVADNGCYTSDTPLFAGLHVLQANNTVIEECRNHGNLLHAARLQHSYPHCWRHKTPVIFRATPQWFVSMEQQHLRTDTLKAIDGVQWIPDWGQARIAGMIAGRPDWCISRQRTWCMPLTVFLHKDTKELHPDSQRLMAAVAERVEQQGLEAWYALDASEFLGADSETYQKSVDTLDVWFDSGVSHTAVLKRHPDLAFPANIYLEGSDQHRGWFHTALLSSVAMYGTAPYKQVLTHGFTVDANGHKMSKSRGNVIEPSQVTKQWGADILRLWVAASDYRSELTISDEILKRTADAYRRIRNTARFLLANLFDFDPNVNALDASQMLALDRWVVARALELQTEIITAFNDYQFHVIYQKLHHFCTADLGGFYLDIIKDRQYTMPKNSVGRRSCQTAMYHIAQAFVRWLTPILSFTAEEIWQVIPGKTQDSVFLTEWYTGLQALANDEPLSLSYWQNVLEVRDEVNKILEAARNAGVLGAALEAEVTLYVSPELHAELSQLGEELRFVFICSAVTLNPLKDKPASATGTARADLFIEVTPSTHTKCARCWHRISTVGADKAHPTLCQRCVTNITTDGEPRKFA
jgi:isoleucyl-tRNA synthetase